MPIIESRIDPNSDRFRANREQMLALIGEFRALEQKVRDFSNSRHERFRARKQLLPRERVAFADRSRRAVARTVDTRRLSHAR